MSCVDSISAEGEAQLVGDVTVSAGGGITLTQVGQDIEIATEDLGNPTYATAGVAAASSGGTLLTAPAGANAKANWTQLTASSSIAADGFYVSLQSGDTGQLSYLVDIGVGAAAAEAVVVENIMFHVGADNNGYGVTIYFPIPIAAGSRIVARYQAASATADGVRAMIQLVNGGVTIPMRQAQATTYGAVTADSEGTEIDPGGATNTKGGWVQLTASTTDDIEALVICTGKTNTVPTASNYLLDIGTGAALSETVVVPDLYMRYAATGEVMLPQAVYVPVHIPSGTRVAARAQSSTADATDRLFDVVVIGCGP